MNTISIKTGTSMIKEFKFTDNNVLFMNENS